MEKQIRARDIKLVPIGNSKGVRIPKELLAKYGFKNALLLEETDRGLLLRKKDDSKLTWEDTYKAMADEKEDWSDFDVTLLDGFKTASKMENPPPDQLCK
jgi:antitoxin MazE